MPHLLLLLLAMQSDHRSPQKQEQATVVLHILAVAFHTKTRSKTKIAGEITTTFLAKLSLTCSEELNTNRLPSGWMN